MPGDAPVASRSPNRTLRLARRLPYAVVSPLALVCIAVALHGAGRVAALCSPHKVDSLTYAAAAYRFWGPATEAAILVRDKPAGQAFLTGWCFRIAPGPATRRTLIPVESAFLVGGYAVFGLLAARLFGRHVATALTSFLVIAHNTYNALDNTTDGFDLNESYLLAPMAASTFAHLAIRSPMWRGLAQGFAIGVALSVKQTAVGLACVLLLHGIGVAVARRRFRDASVAGAASLVGVVLAWAPLAAFLLARGWLTTHVRDLLEQTAAHGAIMAAAIPPWHKLSPLAPAIGWLILCATVWRTARAGSEEQSEAAAFDYRSAWVLAMLWFGAEALILWSMTKPGTHYYQQIVAPAMLLAGFAIATVGRAFATLPSRQHIRAWQWTSVTTAVLAVVAAMPLLAAASKGAHGFNRQAEIEGFSRRLKELDAQPVRAHVRESEHDDHR